MRKYRPKILIVDRNLNHSKLLEASLAKNSDYEILAIENGGDALGLILKDPPDLIISELFVPQVNGYELFDELQKNELLRLIPFFVVTANFFGDGPYEERPIDAFMKKPVNLIDFGLRVRRLLGPALRYKALESEFDDRQKLEVFLCHAKEDKIRAIEIYKKLLPHGIRPWLDEFDLLPGQDWDFEINRALRRAHLVLILISGHSITKRGYVQKEIKIAFDIQQEEPESGIYIVPALLEDCEVPKIIEHLQWVKLYEKEGLQRLSRTFRLRAAAVNAKSPEDIE